MVSEYTEIFSALCMQETTTVHSAYQKKKKNPN